MIDTLTGWTKVTRTIPAKGAHGITWKYVKDGELFDGDDCIWVDALEWAPRIGDGTGRVVPTEWLERHPAFLPKHGNDYLEAMMATTGAGGDGMSVNLKFRQWVGRLEGLRLAPRRGG